MGVLAKSREDTVGPVGSTFDGDAILNTLRVPKKFNQFCRNNLGTIGVSQDRRDTVKMGATGNVWSHSGGGRRLR